MPKFTFFTPINIHLRMLPMRKWICCGVTLTALLRTPGLCGAGIDAAEIDRQRTLKAAEIALRIEPIKFLCEPLAHAQNGIDRIADALVELDHLLIALADLQIDLSTAPLPQQSLG